MNFTKGLTTGIYAPTILKRVEYGLDSLSKLGEILQNLSIGKPLIITGKSLATKTNVIEKVKQASQCDDVTIFSSIKQHAPIENIKSAIVKLKEINADGVIAVGGGSPIDAAKLVIHFYREETGHLLKLISIPTTLSAAEFTVIAGYTDESGKKTGYKSTDSGSSVVILDGNLSLSTPIRLWLSTGIRALDHCVEQQYRRDASPPVRALAREGAAILFESLRACHKDEQSAEVRQKALIGAWLSLWSDEHITSLGPSHSIGYQLGAPYGIPHGICSCLTLAGTVAIQADYLSDADLKPLISLLPFLTMDRSENFGSPREQAFRVADAIKKLIEDLNLTSRLREYYVPTNDFAGIIERAIPAGVNDVRYKAFVKLLQTLY